MEEDASNEIVIYSAANGQKQIAKRRPQAKDNDDNGGRNRFNLRQFLRHGFESKNFHKILLILILLEWVIIGCELIIDLYTTGAKMGHISNTSAGYEKAFDFHTIKEVLRVSSFTIQCIFVLEVILKIIAYQKEFFKKKHEIFDACVILLSFTLSLIFIKAKWLHYSGPAIVLLRIWNALRLIYGMLEFEHEAEEIDDLEMEEMVKVKDDKETKL